LRAEQLHLATVDEVLGVALASGPRPVVLIDGGSGAGKSTLASALIGAWPGRVALVRLDDIYPGWGGLEAASEHVLEHVLATEEPSWRRWDWMANAPAEWHSIDPALPLIIEGSGSLSRANRDRATLGVWVHASAATRKLRALTRDGAMYRAQWDRWAAQERRFALREHPHGRADVVFAGG
jgi:energy-coupling factor transporter ATP-binding protein EcfA2